MWICSQKDYQTTKLTKHLIHLLLAPPFCSVNRLPLDPHSTCYHARLKRGSWLCPDGPNCWSTMLKLQPCIVTWSQRKFRFCFSTQIASQSYNHEDPRRQQQAVVQPVQLHLSDIVSRERPLVLRQWSQWQVGKVIRKLLLTEGMVERRIDKTGCQL